MAKLWTLMGIDTYVFVEYVTFYIKLFVLTYTIFMIKNLTLKAGDAESAHNNQPLDPNYDQA